MAPLHPLPALAATADGNVETAAEGCALDFLLILRLDPLHFQFAATFAVCGRGDRDDFIHFRRNGLAPVLAIGSAGFASWGLGMGVTRAAEKGAACLLAARCASSSCFFSFSFSWRSRSRSRSSRSRSCCNLSFSLRNLSISWRSPRPRSRSYGSFSFQCRRVSRGRNAIVPTRATYPNQERKNCPP